MYVSAKLRDFWNYLVRNRRKVLIVVSVFLTLAGWWQLDLLCSPAVWNPLDWSTMANEKIFLLPFNIPLSQTLSYCLFYLWMMSGYGILFLIALLPKDKDEEP
jgi:hypothetical protein